jgi:hypothetical protein
LRLGLDGEAARKMIRRFGQLAITALALVVLGYIASPFVAAFEIRRAIDTGDVAALERRIDFSGVRAGLKTSTAEVAPEEPTLRQRVTGTMTTWLIDHYVTAEGLGKLVAMRHGWLATTLGISSTADRDAGLIERITRFCQRIRRAEFRSLHQFELEMVDRRVADRIWIGHLDLRNGQWVLTRVELHQKSALKSA